MREIIIGVPDGFGKTLKPEKVNSEINGEIVRCKDCKFSKPDWEKAVWCEREDCRRHENWYCADGEKKEV